MSDKDIIKIIDMVNVRIRNKHNGVLYPIQDVVKVVYRDNTYRVVDMFSKRDITDIDYFEIVETNKTEVLTIFQEIEEE